MRGILDGKILFLAFATVAVWAIVVLLSGAGLNIFPFRWNFESTGQFGDSFGSLSSIMAALAALAALSTLRATQSEIQRITLKDKDENSQQEAAKDHLREREVADDKRSAKAEFERTFFQLLNFFNDIVSETDIVNQSKQHPQKGRDAFKAIIDTFYRAKGMYDLDDAQSYKSVLDKYPNDLNHYFRFLYHVVLFVHKNHAVERYFYIRLVRATLSEAELGLLALNCIYGEGREKFKDLVEEYALLHNLSVGTINKLKLETHFSPRAFEYAEPDTNRAVRA